GERWRARGGGGSRGHPFWCGGLPPPPPPRLVTTGRRRTLRLTRHWPWTDVITSAVDRLQALPNPG
ncbi:hypothetical protein ACFW9X_27175, partial [Streptomyces sp. NPDC059466]|uniref:hypothetical protein n=1 Tax=Streptomyces sp. NPDC059466 TaxID=3346843 RepID=UPI0036999B96